MKILIVFNHPAPYKVRLFNELAKTNDLEVIFERTKAKDRPDSFYNCNEYNFKHIFYKHGYFSNEQSNTGKLKRYLKAHHLEYDLIIMNGYSTFTEMRGINYLRKKKIPFVLFINGGIVNESESKLKKKIKTKYISSASWYFSPCEEADDYLKYYGANEKGIYHYPYSTFYESELLKDVLTEKEKNSIRKKWNIPNTKIFLSAGQFIDRKNNEQLIKLFKNRNDKLILIGEGPLKEKYEKILEEENITNVEIRPFLKKNDLFEVMKCSDAFITLSKEDIYGHTTTEAMANGLPVISSKNVVSSKHLIHNGLNGYLVDINHESDILLAMDYINPSMSKNALETARSTTFEASAIAINKAMEEIMR